MTIFMKSPIIPAVILAAFAAFLGGCASKPIAVVKPELVIPPPQIPVGNEANVWLPDEIKAYPINRYVDPSNPNILHERHVIYRREQAADWRLQANADRQILVGNTMGDGEQDLKPALLDQELARELQRQRSLGLVANQDAAFLVEKSGAMTEAAQALIAQSQELRRLLDQKEAENKRLLGELDAEKQKIHQQELNSAIDPATGLPRSSAR